LFFLICDLGKNESNSEYQHKRKRHYKTTTRRRESSEQETDKINAKLKLKHATLSRIEPYGGVCSRMEPYGKEDFSYENKITQFFTN
jgi:hypothetical protein